MSESPGVARDIRWKANEIFTSAPYSYPQFFEPA
eukprot:CAMPEP_0197423276 /NCGR_PEP_ID=MMETSP1170-20131217/20542_1 /TAXON_ID=54406 /ORGANISM="Sarcinochrysis sp, Strain CCMP770" /LENGTH=33 /DNA_ID= /DNA_START= /DNA_END= /DNA_ORIENTATION=